VKERFRQAGRRSAHQHAGTVSSPPSSISEVRALGQGHPRRQASSPIEWKAEETHPDIRDAVRALCAGLQIPATGRRSTRRAALSGSLRRSADQVRGWMSALIPEEHGRLRGCPSPRPRLNHGKKSLRSGGHARLLPRPDVQHEHPAAERLARAEEEVPAEIATGELRLQSMGVTEPTRAPTPPASRPWR
jgi:hypothetical protein